MTESQSASTAEARPQSDKPSTIRLVIRAEIIPDTAPTIAPQSSNKRMLAVIAGVVAVLALTWIGISVFKSEPASAPVASEAAQKSEPALPASGPASIAASAIGTGSAASTAETNVSTPEVRSEPVNEVVPTPSQSALQTIRGTIRVSVRVTIDKQGTVTAAVPEDPGPSRYFERLSVEAAKKWTFAPVNGDEQRTMLLRFHFTREGATARVDD